MYRTSASTNGYKGSSNLQTSTSNMEVVPTSPVGFTSPRYSFYEFNFYNDQDCHIQVNGDTNQIFLRAGQNFNMKEPDKEINSFLIVESGITFVWNGKW